MQTRQQLISAIARVLGMLPSGQTIAPEDYADLDAQLDPALAELRARDVYCGNDTAEFDDEVTAALADCVAVVCASQNEVTQLRGLTVEQFRLLAETRLRQISAGQPIYTTLKAVYF